MKLDVENENVYVNMVDQEGSQEAAIFIDGNDNSQLVPVDQENLEDLPSEEDLETYRIVFELFDRDHSGFIDKHDLAAIAVKLGKEPSEGKTDY